MPIAEEFQLVSDRVAVWQAYEPAVKCDLSSTAIATRDGLVFIDPIPLRADALAELVAGTKPHMIVLTNGNHARAAADFAAKFSIPIAATPAAEPELGIAIDVELADGDPVSDARVISIDGAGPGEFAVHFGGVVVMGDALINLEPHGFGLLPEKYCADAAVMRAALGKLLRIEFEVLTFAHGLPLVSRARQKLESLLA